MKTKQRLVPELRFPEFEGEWEVRKLGSFLEFKNGINATKEQYGKGIKFINVLDIINNEFINHEKIVGRVDVDESIIEKYDVTYGDILFQRSSETREEVGQSNVYLDRDKTVTFGGFVIRGKKKAPYDPLYMNYVLKTSKVRKEMISRAGGSTRYNIGQDTLRQIPICMSSNNGEQQKIATFLSTLDRGLQQLRQKITLLEQYKKGMMQQLFSQQVRFKDEEGRDFPDWEEKKLGEVLLGIKSGKAKLHKEGNFPIFGSSGKIGFSDSFTHEGKYILVGRVGARAGNVFMVNGKFSVTDNALILSFNSENDLVDFFYYKLTFFNLKKLSFGTGQPLVTGGQIKKLRVATPSLPEQQKIATFLSALDAQLDGVRAQLTQWTAYEKGLLQRLLI